jgi:hypothetical protein
VSDPLNESMMRLPPPTVTPLRWLIYLLLFAIAGILTFSSFTRTFDQAALGVFVSCHRIERQRIPSPSGSTVVTVTDLDCPGNLFFRSWATVVTLHRTGLPLPEFLTGTDVYWYRKKFHDARIVWQDDNNLSINGPDDADFFSQNKWPAQWHGVRIEH